MSGRFAMFLRQPQTVFSPALPLKANSQNAVLMAIGHTHWFEDRRHKTGYREKYIDSENKVYFPLGGRKGIRFVFKINCSDEYQAFVMIREKDQESNGEASNYCVCLSESGQLPVEGKKTIYIGENGADICPPCFACLRKGTPLQTPPLGYFLLFVKYHNCFADISAKCSTFAEKCGII